MTDPGLPSADTDPPRDPVDPVTPTPDAASGGDRDSDSSPSSSVPPGPGALDPDVAWVQAADALWRELPDAVVVLSPAGDERREPLAISGPGAELWHVLAEPLTAAGAADALARVYDVDAETILGDLESVLAALVDAGVIVATP